MTTTSVPRSPDTAPAAAPPASLFLRRLSPETLCLRIPDFNPSRYEPLRRLLDESSAELDATDNLVIDLRSHRGGSDAVFEPILRLLYTRPIIQIGVEYRSTEDNIAEMRRWCATTPLRAEIKQEVERIADLMSTHPGEWVASPSRGFYVERMDSVSSCPKRVAVLIDGAASSGEQFLLLARQSRKVTLFGKRNSAGVLDFSNAVSATVPSGRFTLRWAICRSLRLPEDPVDPEGIPPDIRIPAEVDDPVAYAQAWLERQAD
jgi:C-terminal processing protease CtpA/Prc